MELLENKNSKKESSAQSRRIPIALLREKIPGLLWSRLLRNGILYVDDVLKISLEEFADLPGVGSRAVEMMKELQQQLKREPLPDLPSVPDWRKTTPQRPILSLPEDSPLRTIRFDDIALKMPGLLYAKLKMHRFESLDDLCLISLQEFASLPYVGAKTVRLLSRFLVDLLADPDSFLPKPSPESTRFLPVEVCESAPSFKVFVVFLDAFVQFLKDSDSKGYEVFRWYYGWGTDRKLRHLEIGQRLGVSRERVRQILVRVFEQMRMLIFDDEQSFLDDRSRHAVRAALEHTYGSWSEKKVVPASRIAEVAGFQGNSLSEKIQAAIEVVFRLYGVRKYPIYKFALLAPHVYIFDPHLDMALFLKTARCVINMLSAYPVSVSVASLKQRLALECPEARPEYVDILLDSFGHLFERVGQEADPHVQLRFDLLPSCAKMAWRVLYEAGQPLHYREILQIINRRLEQVGSDKQFSGNGFVALMKGEEEVVFLGKTGKYALRSWGTDTRYLKELVESAFDHYGRPLTLDEVFRYVNGIRPGVNRKSLQTILSHQCRSIRRGRYVPRHWENAAE